MAKKNVPHIIVYGNYIAEQNIATQNNYYGEEKQTAAPQKEQTLSATALKGFIEAGLLDPDLMPAQDLSRGQKAVLAHDIAERLKMEKFWSFFEKKWGINYLASDYTRFTKSSKFSDFQKRLNKIK